MFVISFILLHYVSSESIKHFSLSIKSELQSILELQTRNVVINLILQNLGYFIQMVTVCLYLRKEKQLSSQLRRSILPASSK